jgi:hypothetical protein
VTSSASLRGVEGSLSFLAVAVTNIKRDRYVEGYTRPSPYLSCRVRFNFSKLRTAALVAAAFIAACASAPHNPVLDSYPAGIVGHTSVLYYDVHGRTLDELRADMRRLGPKVADSSFVGETRSPMRWSWRTESANGTCSIRDVSVSVNAQITLPVGRRPLIPSLDWRANGLASSPRSRLTRRDTRTSPPRRAARS